MLKEIKPYFFLFIFLVVIAFNLYLLSPLFHTFALATIIASVFYPLMNWLVKKNIHKKHASLICTLGVLLTVFVPSVYLIFQLTQESLHIYEGVRDQFSQDVIKSHFEDEGVIADIVNKGLEFTGSSMTKEQIYQVIIEKARTSLGSLIKLLNGLVANIFYLIFQFIILLLMVYSLFLSGDKLKEYFFKLSPLPEDQEQKILNSYNQMNYVTLVGNGLGGIIQGTLAGIAFWVAGLPSVFLWTTFMIILAFIPIVGMSVIFIPATIYLIMIGKVTAGVILFVWCTLVSLVVENVFKPKFVGDRLQINGVLLLLYIIAGMSVFGALGLFYGPLLCIVFLTVSEIFTSYYLYSRES